MVQSAPHTGSDTIQAYNSTPQTVVTDKNA